ncbi:MAG: pilus assembly protein [Deltaproteobacteria bacterium]|nr:MAG: pilus assembly protein [Deltaproteobacteria bacterium]
MVEMAIVLPITAFLIFFFINLSITVSTIHKVHYLCSRAARTVSLSRDREVKKVLPGIRERLTLSLFREWGGGSISSLKLSLKDWSEKHRIERGKLKPGQKVTLQIEAVLPFSLTPLFLLPDKGRYSDLVVQPTGAGTKFIFIRKTVVE